MGLKETLKAIFGPKSQASAPAAPVDDEQDDAAAAVITMTPEPTGDEPAPIEIEIEGEDDEEEEENEDNNGSPEKAEPDMSTPPHAEGDVAQAPSSASDSSGAGADSDAENQAGAPTPRKDEDNTMADENKKGATTPSTGASAGGNGTAAGVPETKTKATLAELKQAFPADRDFACECFEKGMALNEAKAAKFDADQAAKLAADQKAAALGNNGKGAKAPLASLGRPITGNAAADRESVMHTLAGSASTDPRGKLIAAGLMDSITGKVGPVTNAERLGYDGIVGTYMDAGLTFAEASREAQTHHREHWNAKREELAESYSGKAQARESRVRSGTGR